MEVLLYPKCTGICIMPLNCFLSTFYCLILHRVSMFFFSKFLNKINVFITCVKKKHPRFYLYYS